MPLWTKCSAPLGFFPSSKRAWIGIADLDGFCSPALPDQVDLLLEKRDGSLLGIEVKASATVGAGDFKGLRALEALTGNHFQRGVVLYTGERVVPFGDKLFAVPLSALWSSMSH